MRLVLEFTSGPFFRILEPGFLDVKFRSNPVFCSFLALEHAFISVSDKCQ
ncbi:hypothetical protein MNBD_ALPHA11-1354 [hydrothermal vent metagenome]|uniref:Uncharacterized protein n=1 Tax=hydrothermal vent metagenome TaxID=652676 RepID=A0A3B0TQ76_9ZZZZ